MLSGFKFRQDLAAKESVVAIHLITKDAFPEWLKEQSATIQSWIKLHGFKAEAMQYCFVPKDSDTNPYVLLGYDDEHFFWNLALANQLPEGIYEFSDLEEDMDKVILAWGLSAYQFTQYKQAKRNPATLLIANNKENLLPLEQVKAIYLVRDLINTPTEDLGPENLALAVKELANLFDAEFKQIIGDDLLMEHFPAIHAVGRASDEAPRLLELRWGESKHPKLTLVGKGVCFDTGGLDLKPAANMLLMKKDMGGAAHVLGLAYMIMAAELPVCLRVLIPAVENAVAGNAYRPSDVLQTRKGITIEIGNTDAEGRVILADALTEAASEDPELIIDISTLTGAARVALGTEIPVMFCNDNSTANQLLTHSEYQRDPIWRLPLYKPYREYLNSSIADINNNSSIGYGGAITAALFLQEFIKSDIPWIHFDLMAWNIADKPGKPIGGEAQALRALFSFIQEKFSSM